VKNARYVAVELADGRKVVADVLLLDPRHDLAILKVNRSVVGNLAPLPLLPAEADPSVRAGIPAVAFGSPLSQTFLMTQGIVSKVEERVLLGDFLIQPGNSGGPLVNLAGQVIGVNTFGEGRTSGAVRVNLLRDILAAPRVASTVHDEPSAELLPTARRGQYPADLLKSKVVTEELDVRSYRLDAGRFTITALTPVLVAKSNVQADLRQAANRYSRRGKKIRTSSTIRSMSPSTTGFETPPHTWI
jgi:S1-C subfamily serine protease